MLKNIVKNSVKLLALLYSCTSLASTISYIKLSNEEAYNIIDNMPQIDNNFTRAINHSIDYYRSLSGNSVFRYNDVTYSSYDMIAGLLLFKCIAQNSKDKTTFKQKLMFGFDIYETKNNDNRALITGYYTPILEGSFTPTERFKYGIYRNPDRSRKFPLSRQEIEANPERYFQPLVYVDSRLDQYFSHIQGSVLVHIVDQNKLMSIGYDANNNFKYRPIGKVLIDEGKIAKEDMSMQEIRRYVDKYPQELERLIQYDPSYVFFRKTKHPTGNIGYPVVANVSIAMDHRLMPKGSLAFIKTTIPDIKYKDSDYTKRNMPRQPYSRFKLVQDTGGAIKGGGRVDVYFGEGKEAEFYAGMMAEDGRVLLLAPKKEALNNPDYSQKLGCFN